MNLTTQSAGFNQELTTIEYQIDLIVNDIGRLSAYSQSASETISKIKCEKLSFLHVLKEKKEKLLNRLDTKIV